MKKIILIINLVFIYSITFAQIKGEVKDDKGELIPGVNVVIKGTLVGTITDFNGIFTIDAKKGDTLIFSTIGYESQEIPLVGQSEVNVVLRPDIIDLNEVVVMGYSNKTKMEISSSVTIVESKDLVDVTSNDVGDMLQGKVSGLQVVAGSGQPGSSAEIRIRGISTIKPGNAEPLYVVDGIIGGDFNPNDVETITVLKDAGATGMYGARANKGVIVVTTKRAKQGKTNFEFKSNVGYKIADHGNLKMMNGADFHKTTSELYRDPVTHQIDKIKFYQDFPKSLADKNFNWVDEAFKPALTQNYYLSASGREDKMSYYISTAYFDEKGTFRNTGYKSLNMRANTKYDFTDRISLNNNINIGMNNNTSYDYMDMYYSYLSLPWDNGYDANGNPVYVDGTTKDWWSRDKINPLHTIDNSEHSGKGFSMNYDLVFNAVITKWLTFTSSNRLSYNSD
jgi:TonB-linked SusC/RagA family outer membrane protein